MTDPSCGMGDQPELLTVSEAARRLGIGRSLAYQLATAFLHGDPEGLPVIRLGGLLRVPCFALEERIRYGKVVTDLVPGPKRRSTPGSGRHPVQPPTDAVEIASVNAHVGVQLSLLDDC